MSAVPSCALLASLSLFCLAPQSPQAPDAAPVQGYVVQYEAWDASDPALVQELEALEPTAADDALRSLRGAGQGAQRMARVLSPIDLGSQVRFQSQHEHATVQNTMQGGGTVQSHFGGYTSTGTEVLLTCRAGSAPDQVRTSFSLEASGMQEKDDERGPSIPPDRRTIQVHSEGTSSSGELRMYQFQTSEPGTLVVFVRATAL